MPATFNPTTAFSHLPGVLSAYKICVKNNMFRVFGPSLKLEVYPKHVREGLTKISENLQYSVYELRHPGLFPPAEWRFAVPILSEKTFEDIAKYERVIPFSDTQLIDKTFAEWASKVC
jgi:hypothetical protein